MGLHDATAGDRTRAQLFLFLNCVLRKKFYLFYLSRDNKLGRKI